MKLTNKKIILSGSTVEEYSYGEKPLSYDFEVGPNNRVHSKIVVVDEESKNRKEESMSRSLNRTRSNLRRLVNTNAWQWLKKSKEPYLPVFVTFTFEENIQDIKRANKLFTNFIKRLNHKLHIKNRPVKYAVVIEFQKRGAAHYHAIFFNLPYVEKDEMYRLWGQGFIDIKAIDDVDNAGAYIAKYMSKKLEDDRLNGRKRYFTSRNLKKPIEVKNQLKADLISKSIPKKFIAREGEFDSAYNGKVKYVQYKLGKKQSLFDILPNLEELL